MGKKRYYYPGRRPGKRVLLIYFFLFTLGIFYVCRQEKGEDGGYTYGEAKMKMEEAEEVSADVREEESVKKEDKETTETESVVSEEETEDTGSDLLLREYLTADTFEEAVGGQVILENGGEENSSRIKKLYESRSLEYLIQNFYIVNPTTTIDKKIFQVDEMLDKDCTIQKEAKKPQILIFHTHGASEVFSDSRKGVEEDSVIGVGTRLQEILQKKYGYQVLHDTTPYDLIDGKIDRNQAYTVVEETLAKKLEESPSIEVMIDLHRDASSDGKTKRVTVIDGKKTAQVMFFNGLSRNLSGNIKYLYNPNLRGNLAFSLQMKLKAMEYYPDFTLPIFLKGYRYSLHMREKSLLIELGNEVNTVEEAKNAMEPLAKVLDAVLSGKE